MNSPGRLDHWTTSLDAVDALRARLAQTGADGDQVAQGLMAQVMHAKSSSFIALLDVDGHVLDVNPAALIAGGLDRSEVIGLPLWTTAWWSEAGAESARYLQDAVAGAVHGRFARFDTDVKIEGAGRDTGTLDLVLRPLRGRNGQVAFVVAEGRAITDRKRVEQRLARQNAELSALTQRLARVHDYRERLLGELSHDLRAPLQAVITRAEQVLRSHPDAEYRGQMVNIRLSALSALEQINDMLEQVRADHGEVQLTLVDANLAEAVRTVTEQFEPLAVDREIDLAIDVPDEIAARFDVERVSRIVSNLLANAIRHAPVGGTVRCSLSSEDGAAMLSVADSGPGVPPEHRDKVFGRFRSGLTGDGRAGTGAGLGLAIVREFVELHGGEVSLGVAPEGGALFLVSLPLRPPDGERVPATLAQHAAAAQRTEFVRSQLEAELTAAPTPPPVPTVVIVERVSGRADAILGGVDDAAVTAVADDALEALRLATELRPDAVVVGTATGDMSSTSLLRRLAADERLVGVRRVALAGEREVDPSPEELIAAGAQLVLPASAADELGGRLWAAATGTER